MLKWLLPVLGLLSLLCVTAHTEEISLAPGDGCNLTIRERVSPTHLVAGLTTPVHNWFAGTLTHLPTDEVTIDIPMTGNDGGDNKGDVHKWVGLRPLLTYADPMRYEAYESFTKTPEGLWLSQDPLKTGKAKEAGHGVVPQQTVVPAEVAEQFLSADKQRWFPWREVETVEANVDTNTFSIKQRFALPTATLAMRVPFTDAYLQAFLAKLQAQHLPGVTIDSPGATLGKRTLSIIRVDDPTPAADGVFRPTVLVTAGEHATEHASGWAAFGMLARLIHEPPTSSLRKGRTWLFLPIVDPDGRAQSMFDRITEECCALNTGHPEMFAYTRYLTDFAFPAGRPIDVVVDLHNLEANEGMHLISPIVNIGNVPLVRDFNRLFFTQLAQQGYTVGDAEKTPEMDRVMRSLLYGWCTTSTASFDLVYEVNDRYPPHRLSLPELQGIGVILDDELAAWCDSAAGQQWHQQACQVMAKRVKDRVKYFQERDRDPADRTPFDTIIQGY